VRIYYEAKEITETLETEADFARIDVTDLTPKERDGVLVNLKSLIPGAVYSRHDCGHDDRIACKPNEKL